jgi:plastocyanin
VHTNESFQGSTNKVPAPTKEERFMRHQRYIGLKRLAGLISMLLVVGAGVVGFAGGAGSSAFAAGTATVTVGTTLSPQAITVAPGTTITWLANGGGKHRIESTSGPAKFKSDDLKQGKSWSFTFTKEGMYAYGDHEHDKNPALQGMVMVSTTAPSTGGAAPAPAAPAPKTAAVSLVSKSFSPASVTVALGGTVTWTNNDSMPHNVTATGGAFKSTTLAPGAVFSFKFTTPGTFAYSCTFHGGMNGTVIVPTATGSVPPPVPGAPVPPAPAPGAPAPPAPPAVPGAPAPTTAAVSLAGQAFSPASVTVAVGGTVTWTNNDSMPHNVTANAGAFKSTTLAPGAVFSFKFTTPGTFAYNCTFHGGMNGTVIVPTASGSVPPPVAGAAGAAGAPAVAGAVPAGVAAAPGKPGKHIVLVSDTGFSPAVLNARAGDTVTWVNKGQAPHTATAAGGAFDLPLAPGASASTVLQKPGTISYVCTYHVYMKASIIVAAALPGTVIGAANNTKAAAAGATKPASAAPASTGKTKTVEIKVNEMTFGPAMANANVGDTISWVNVGKIAHTVTAKDGSFDKTPIAPGERFNYVLRKEGSVPYVCSYHPGMDGMLMVGPALAGVVVPGAADAKTKALSPAPVSKGSAQTHVIEVKDSSFTPATQAARVGDTISWVNLGKIPHTVTARDHSFDKTLKPGQRFNLVLTKEGTIRYVCTPHPGMFGELIVGPALSFSKSTQAPPRTLAAMSPVALVGVGTGWLLIIGLLTVVQLRSRITAGATKIALRGRASTEDPS